MSTSRPHPALLPTLVLALTGVGLAQERVPLPAPDAGQPVAPRHTIPEVPPVTAKHFVMEPLDDEPDFAPMEDVRDADGHVIATRPAGNPYVLDFVGGRYVPEPGVDPRLEAALLARPEGHTYGFVMLKGRMSEAKQQRLRDAGLELYGIHTYQCLKVKIDAGGLAVARGLPNVLWIGYARPEQKMDPELAERLVGVAQDQRVRIRVLPFTSDLNEKSRRVVDVRPNVPESGVGPRGAAATGYTWIPDGPFQRRLSALGFTFERYNQYAHAFTGTIARRDIARLVAADFVHVLTTPAEVAQPDHDQTMSQIHQDYVRRYYPGDGVQVGIIDTGIDSTPWHQDFGGMFYVFWGNGINPNPTWTNPWHGTHVAGTILGGGNSDVRYRGCVPKVGRGGRTNRVYLSDFGTADSTNISAFARDYTDGNGNKSLRPSVINCSYSRGTSTSGYFGTDADSITFDDAVYANRQLYVFSAGNKGTIANNWGSRPGVAKNVLTVGALLDRFNSTRTTNPGNRASFSRWGTRDYRTKPELSAPGDELTSTDWNTSTGYRNSQGTSMSAPMVTGALASRIDRSSWYAYRPEALKAIAVASAKSQNQVNSGVWAPPQPGSSNRQTTGYGMINSKTMCFPSTETQAFIWGGTFTAAGQSYSDSFTIPADAKKIRMVLCYTERSASPSATQARLNNLRAHLDFAPYTANNTSGDYTATASYNNVIVRDDIPVGVGQGGSVLRVKVHAASLPTPNAYWAVAIMVYRKTSNINAPEITAEGDDYIQPSSQYTLVGTMKSSPTGDDFRSGRLWYDGPFSFEALDRVLEDGTVHKYDKFNSHPSNVAPNVAKGAGAGIVVGTGSQRAAIFRLLAPSINGVHNLYIRGTWGNATSPAPFVSKLKQVCVDGVAPNTITGLKSTSHTVGAWSKDTTIDFQWNQPSDAGCAGIHGLAYHFDKTTNANPGVIDQLGAANKTSISKIGDSSSGWYFHVRPRDRAGNYGATTHLGPFKIDTAPPVLNSVVLDKGAATTNSLSVDVTVSATDPASGLLYVRYGAKLGYWGPWMPYQATRTINLTSFAGTSAPGLKTVWAQVIDVAYNESTVKSDTITYAPAPTISAITPSLANNTKRYFKITGTNLDLVTQVNIGGQAITDIFTLRHEDHWFTGRLRPVSATELHLFPPQNLGPGNHAVTVRTAAGALSNSLPATVTTWTTSANHMDTEARLNVGATQHILASRGTNPAGTTQITMFSGIKKPSSIPGFVNLDIGGNWVNFFLLPRQTFSAKTGNSVFSIQVPPLAKGFTLHFQTLFIHANGAPLQVSPVRSTTYL